MIFREQAIEGVFAVEPEPAHDDRGLFARTYDRAEFAARGIALDVAQASVSYNARRGTLRGMHVQVSPHEEAKLVRCVAGSAYDVVVDLRAGSPTQLRWLAVELVAEKRNAVYIPTGCAHGFVTLVDHTELEYLISTPYAPEAAAGVHWEDPAVGIGWPMPPVVVSERDSAFPHVDVEAVRRAGPRALVQRSDA